MISDDDNDYNDRTATICTSDDMYTNTVIIL